METGLTFDPIVLYNFAVFSNYIQRESAEIMNLFTYNLPIGCDKVTQHFFEID